MTIQIRTAVDGEETDVLSFYERLIDKMKGSPYPLRWEKGVYPTYTDIADAIRSKTMYIAEDDSGIIGAFTVNHTQGEGYAHANWLWRGDEAQAAVLHLLAVAPSVQRRGVGKALLQFAVDCCRADGSRALRLDTLPWNLPGKRLYEGFGFQYRGDVEVYYPSTGQIAFSMYELLL
ncbi:MAG: GNAT family N-acetyltransferase [Oscillospiraceae bacterium]|nr:GNAT family N-acetyltransferase [Oscillospiraceae bacterium]